MRENWFGLRPQQQLLDENLKLTIWLLENTQFSIQRFGSV